MKQTKNLYYLPEKIFFVDYLGIYQYLLNKKKPS